MREPTAASKQRAHRLSSREQWVLLARAVLMLLRLRCLHRRCGVLSRRRMLHSRPCRLFGCWLLYSDLAASSPRLNPSSKLLATSAKQLLHASSSITFLAVSEMRAVLLAGSAVCAEDVVCSIASCRRCARTPFCTAEKSTLPRLLNPSNVPWAIILVSW